MLIDPLKTLLVIHWYMLSLWICASSPCGSVPLVPVDLIYNFERNVWKYFGLPRRGKSQAIIVFMIVIGGNCRLVKSLPTVLARNQKDLGLVGAFTIISLIFRSYALFVWSILELNWACVESGGWCSKTDVGFVFSASKYMQKLTCKTSDSELVLFFVPIERFCSSISH